MGKHKWENTNGKTQMGKHKILSGDGGGVVGEEVCGIWEFKSLRGMTGFPVCSLNVDRYVGRRRMGSSRSD
jgi:hypothetical protein